VTTDTLAGYADAPDVIVHCGRSGFVAYSMSHPARISSARFLDLRSPARFQRLYAPGARLVIPSSAGVYGLVETMPISVTTPPNPVFAPTETNKMIVEDLARSYARHFRA